jgi:hypothetical protein
LSKEPFDYSEWQRDLYNDMTVDELFNAASDYKESAMSEDNTSTHNQQL